MKILFRFLAIVALSIPFWTGGCIEVVDPAERSEAAEMEEDVLTGENNGTDASFVEPEDWGFDDESSTGVGSEQSAESGESAGPVEPEEIDEESAISEREVPDVDLVVDEDAPELEIVDISLNEGAEQHYFSVTCHDPEVSNTRWVSARRTRMSRRCDVDIATAAQAVSIEPGIDVRIAPTPRGFRILGGFEQGEYEVEISAGLRTDDGSYLHESRQQTVDVPALSESLSFIADGRYLPQSAWDELSFEHRNVEAVDFKVRHVPKDNLSYWIAQSVEQTDEMTSNVVVDTEIPVVERLDETITSSVSIEDQLGEPRPGLYEMVLSSEDAEVTSRLQVTDINLIAKRHEAAPDAAWEEHLDVWAVDMETTEPISGVFAEAIRPSGATMAWCRTDSNGHCQLELPDSETDPTPPVAIIGERGDDLTYLKFDDLRIESGVDAADGPAYRQQRSYLSTMYGERDLYRPGDDVHIMGALRELDYRAPDRQIPVELTIRDPEGEIVAERSEETDNFGTFEQSFGLSDVAPTGRWRAELEVGTREIETYSFHVEEFVPERLEVDVVPTSETFVAGEQAPTFDISATYLFGAGAAGSDVELHCRLVPVDSAVDTGGYHYGPLEIEEDREVIDLATTDGVIGEGDTVEMSCPSPDRRPRGSMRVEATVSVAEGGSGRTTRGAADAKMVPSPVQIGLSTPADDIDSGEELAVSGQLVDVDGQRIEDDAEVTLEFYNIRRHRSWQRDPSTRRHRVHHDYQLILERAVDVEAQDGQFDVSNTVADVDYAYLVRAHHEGATTDLEVQRRGRSWHWSGQRNRIPQPRRASEVTIDTPEQIPVGEATTIDYTAPFKGRALMTVETDGVIHQEWVEAQEGDNRWSFGVDTDEPNVYVAAFIIRNPHEVSEAAFAPERAFGAVSVPVDRSRVETDVVIDAPEEIRSGETFTVDIATGIGAGPAVATVAAVDEGILQLTGYDSPDPLEAMWTERAPGVSTYDTIGWATRLPSVNPSSRTGGGAPADAESSEGRILPFEPVALWSGPVDVGEDGRARVQFDVPEYRGRLRVMTSVFGADTMGAAEQDVLVRDPLTVQTTFPRQMTEDDEAHIPVFVTNLTDEQRVIDVDIGADAFDVPGFDATPDDAAPVVDFFDGTSRDIELAPDESTALYFGARALRPGGAAEVTVEVTSGEHRSVDTGRIPFRPQGPTERRVHTVSLDDGTTDLTPYLDGWVPTSEQSNFFVSTLPEPEAFDHLEYLVRYPFGCAEQTLSSARPLVALPGLVENIDPQFAGGGSGMDEKIEHGIDRMLSMQHASGGVGFWPHHRWSSTAYPRITAKTLDFFVQADEQGFDVPRERIESAAEWLSGQVSGSADDAFEHYVLARVGEAQTSDIRNAIHDLPDDIEGRDFERAYLLWAALYLAGDRSYADELADPQFETGDGGRSRGRFYSHRRQRAMILAVFIELFGRDDTALPLVRAVTEDLLSERRGRLTTQELVWALDALGSWYETEGLDDIDIGLEADGRRLRTDYVGGHPSWSLYRASEFDDVDLVVDSAEFDGELNLMINSQGVRQDPEERIGGEGLRVDRTYLDEYGDEVEDDEIEPGDVIYVQIELENESGSRVRDLALVDRLPAALEVENPDLGAAELPSWAVESWETDNINVRDDRVEMFGGLFRNESIEMVYPTRATMSGDFYVPSIEVEGMYDPETWARGKSGELSVKTAPES